MRWRLREVLYIAALFKKGLSWYAMAKFCGLNRGVLRRIHHRLPKLRSLFRSLTRESGLGDDLWNSNLADDVLALPRRWPCWAHFAWQLRHALYPLTRSTIIVPHNLTTDPDG